MTNTEILAQLKIAEKAAELKQLNKSFGYLLRKYTSDISYNKDGSQVYGHFVNGHKVYLTVKQGKIQDVLEC